MKILNDNREKTFRILKPLDSALQLNVQYILIFLLYNSQLTGKSYNDHFIM